MSFSAYRTVWLPYLFCSISNKCTLTINPHSIRETICLSAGKCKGVNLRLENGVNGFIPLQDLSDSEIIRPEDRQD